MAGINLKAVERYERYNRAAARLILQHPSRYGAALIEWARRIESKEKKRINEDCSTEATVD